MQASAAVRHGVSLPSFSSSISSASSSSSSSSSAAPAVATTALARTIDPRSSYDMSCDITEVPRESLPDPSPSPPPAADECAGTVEARERRRRAAEERSLQILRAGEQRDAAAGVSARSSRVALELIIDRLKAREQARRQHDFRQSDRIRDELRQLGVSVYDAVDRRGVRGMVQAWKADDGRNGHYRYGEEIDHSSAYTALPHERAGVGSASRGKPRHRPPRHRPPPTRRLRCASSRGRRARRCRPQGKHRRPRRPHQHRRRPHQHRRRRRAPHQHRHRPRYKHLCL